MCLSVIVLAVVGLPMAVCWTEPGGKYKQPLFFKSDLEMSAAALNTRTSFEPYDETWDSFKSAFGREYKNKVEEVYRKQVFMDNVKEMEAHNTKFHKGQTTFWMAINQFSDMSFEEYRAYNQFQHTTLNLNSSDTAMRCTPFLKPLNSQLPDTIDWRTKGFVTPVKNQGQCGSCWAFSTTGSLEGQYYRKQGTLVSLSEQQLVDCATPYGTHGCNGGDEPPAYAYIYDAGGINSELDYPYEGRDGPCRFSRSDAVTSVAGCVSVASGSESDLQQAVASQGPVSVNIDANHESFMHYGGGVYYESACSSSQLDHAVLAVGYGTSSTGTQFWIVKNSWGTAWGNSGYILMARNLRNMCGIATEANFPVV